MQDHKSVRRKLQFGWKKTPPVILQTESAECGLACLAMISGFHGGCATLTELRDRYRTSSRGLTLTSLVEIAFQMGLSARPLRLDLSEIHCLKMPCILHWDMQHYVVLTKITRRWAWIIDPARGLEKLSISSLSRHFTGVALEALPLADFKPVEKRKRVELGQLTGRIRGLSSSLVKLFGLSFAIQLLGLASPFFLQFTIDHAVISGGTDLIVVLSLGFLFVAILHVALNFFRAWLTLFISTSVLAQWNSNVLAHLFRLPLPWFEKRHLGDIVSRLGSISVIQRTVTIGFVEGLLDGILSASTFIMMAWYSPMLAMISAFGMVIYVLMRIATFGAFRRANESQLGKAAIQNSHLLETIRGIQSVKTAAIESVRLASWQDRQIDTINQDIQTARLGLTFTTARGLLLAVERIAVISIAGLMVIDGVLTVGMLFAYMTYREQFSARINGLVDRVFEFRLLRMHAERLADIVLAPRDSAISDSGGGVPVGTDLEFENVSFQYGTRDPIVLDNCSFRFKGGQSIAIVGASGAGKSTLIKVLAGLLEPTTGEVRFGGVRFSDLCAREFRGTIGVALQGDQLFAGTIASNIAFGESQPDLAMIETAASLACIHGEIASFPLGYLSPIGDMGSGLSAGQKQRVLLARALYRRPKVLILDEATSHVDVEREQTIWNNIFSLQATKIIVAHRKETISSVDCVLYLENGRIGNATQGLPDAMPVVV